MWYCTRDVCYGTRDVRYGYVRVRRKCAGYAVHTFGVVRNYISVIEMIRSLIDDDRFLSLLVILVVTIGHYR